VVFKSDNKIFGRASGDSSVIAPSTISAAGTAVSLRASVDTPLAGRVRGGLEGEWSHFGGADALGLDGDAFGVGPLLLFPLGGKSSLQLAGQYLLGSIGGGSGANPLPSTDLTGFSASLALVWRTGL
jgi:hypothetical protein